MGAESSPEAAAERLVALANEHGGRDNISLIIVEESTTIEEPPPTEEIPLEGLRPKPSIATIRRGGQALKARSIITSILLLSLLAVLSALAVNWIRSDFTVTFDDTGDVVVMQGRDILWFQPTVVARGPIDRSRLDGVSRDLVDQMPSFPTLREAETFVAEGLTESDGEQPEDDG